MHDPASYPARSHTDHSLDNNDHCHNERCEDSQCENPSCYNYSGHHGRQRHEAPYHEDHSHEEYNHEEGRPPHRHNYPNRHSGHHYQDVLQTILQRHHHHQDNFSDAQGDVSRHQQSLQIQQLQWVDQVLSGLVRSVLERSQHELYERGFSSGIHSEMESVSVEDHPNPNHGHHHSHIQSGDEYNNVTHDYLIAMALHLNDVPTNDPLKNIINNNQIRFYRVADSLDIQCQFSNTKMQSKVFDLSFHHGLGGGAEKRQGAHENLRGGARGLVEDVVQDFISFILLSKRAALNQVNG